MKIDVTMVPRDKCPLDVIADLGQEAVNAWIYLHISAVEKLQSTCDMSTNRPELGTLELNWNATEKFPSTKLIFEYDSSEAWNKVLLIQADDIAFKVCPAEPTDIFFLQMAA